jgi:hypothetical protein
MPESEPVSKNFAPRDFSMELTARSAKWAKQEGSERLYTLTLSGVSKSAKVRSILKSGKVSVARMPFRGLPTYWDDYGERSGQFTDGGESAQAPLAVIAVRGVDGVLLVQLPQLQSSSAGKLVFTARLLVDTDLARYQVRKIGGRYFLKDDLDSLTAVRVPRNRSDVHVVLDFPRKREMPPGMPAAEPAAAPASQKTKKANQTWLGARFNPGRCNGNRSSYLWLCHSGIVTRRSMVYAEPGTGFVYTPPDSWRCADKIDEGRYGLFNGAVTNPKAMNSPGISIAGADRPSYFYYQDVGFIAMSFWGTAMAGAGWVCQGDHGGRGSWSLVWGPNVRLGASWPTEGLGYRYGDNFGIDENWVIWYTVSRCSAFLAAYASSGKCY